ncbi:hypothetical protein Lser_V15G41251 [Lactuca serriola]
MATSSSAHDQTATSSLLTIKPNQNMIIELTPFVYDSYMLYVVECLKYSPLVFALTQVEAVPMSLLSQVYSSATYDRNKDRIYFTIHDKKSSISKAKFYSILGLAVDSSIISPDFITTAQLFTMMYEMGYTDVLTTITKVMKSYLPAQWNGLLTLLIKGLAEQCGGSDTTIKGYLTILYGLYNGINLDYGSIIWSQVVQSLNTMTRHSEISCGRFWTLITRKAIDSLEIPVMKDALLATIATFHTKKIIISDPSKFHHYGLIPETMYSCVSAQSNVMADYGKRSPIGQRVLSAEQQAALDALEQPANRGKRVTKKEKEDAKEGMPKSSKRKSGVGESSQLKPKNLKKMANRPKENSPLGPDPVDDQDEEEENPHVSSRESTPPISPNPLESPKQVLIPTPPPSPKTTKISTPPPSLKTTKVPTPPPSPKQKALLSAPTDIPPILTETTSLPTSSLITSTIPLSAPLITESITTTIPNITVKVNVSNTGATSVTDTPVINIPPSPTPSSSSGATLGGDDEDYDSLYYSPYRIPTENDVDAPVTSQHIQDIHDKLDRLLADSKAYGSVVLKAFLETAIKQYTDAIDRSTDAVYKSASSCAKATKEVSEVVHTTQIFLDSLKSHADTNQAKFQSSVDSFSKTLQDETTKFEALRTELKTESTSFLQSVDSRFVTLAAESTLKEDLIKHQATIDIQKVQLAQAKKEISLLKTQRVVYQSCAGDVKAMLTTLLAAHDPFLTLTIRKHRQSKLLPAISILSEMMGVSEKVVLPKQGGEESAHLKSKTKSKVNLASVSGKQFQIESDSDTEETIAEALQRKKRDRELDETMKVDREAEEKARRNKEEEDALQCKKALFP